MKDIMVPAPDRRGAGYWLRAIKDARSAEREWRDRCHKVISRYRDERDMYDASSRMNILFSNTDVLLAALYQRTPSPDVRRRFMGDDLPARNAAIALERYLNYSIDSYNFDATIRDALKDFLLVGRGTVRVKLSTDTVEKTERSQNFQRTPEGMLQAVETETLVEEIVDQRITCEPVYWEDLVIHPARCWRECEWIAFRHMLDRDELEAQFGQIGSEVAFTHTRDGAAYEKEEVSRYEGRAEVYEVFDKRNRVRLFVSEGHDAVLEQEDDPLGLVDFFPVPEPLYAIRTTDSLIPIAPFTLYQDQVQELDMITERIAMLTDALKRRGVYDASMEGLAQLAEAGDNEFIPIDSFASLLERGGLAAVMPEAPITNIAQVLQQLYQARESVIATIYEVTGLGDILRGVSADRETATTSRTKAFFGSLRLVNQKREVMRFVRDVVRLKAELVAEHLDPIVMSAATQVSITPDVFTVLRDEMGRGYRIDIETDETIAYDETQETQQRIEALTAAGNFIGQAGPLVQSGALPFEAAKMLIMFGLRGFKKGREIEDVLAALQPPPPPQQDQADPAAQLALVEREARAREAELRAQIEQLKAGLKERELAIKEADLVQTRDLKIAELQLDAQELDQKGDLEREKMALRQLELSRGDV